MAREEAVLNERMRSLETQISNIDVEIMRLQEEIEILPRTNVTTPLLKLSFWKRRKVKQRST